MSGFGRYHPFTAKSTLILFALLLVSGFGTAFIPIPYIGLLAVPASMLNGLILNAIGISLPGIVQTLSLVATYYLVAVILGYIVHNFVGGNSL